MQEESAPGYCIYARWPKAIRSARHDWEAWTCRLPSKEIALRAYKRMIRKGADKRYDFALFRSEGIGKPFKLVRRLRA